MKILKAAGILGTVAIATATFLITNSSRAATVAYWRFEPGNFTADSSGNGNTLVNSGVTSSGDIAFNAPGAGSASFDNTSFLNTASSLDLTPYTKLTIEWYQKTSSTADDAVLTHSNGSIYSPPDGGLSVFLNDVDGSVSAIEERGGGGSLNYVYTPFSAGLWDHYAVTIDSAQTGANRFKLYKNYQQTGTYLATTPLNIPFLNETFYFGTIGGTAGLFYTGLLDEVRISDEILAPGDFIPEPSVLTLLIAGALLLWRQRG